MYTVLKHCEIKVCCICIIFSYKIYFFHFLILGLFFRRTNNDCLCSTYSAATMNLSRLSFWSWGSFRHKLYWSWSSFEEIIQKIKLTTKSFRLPCVTHTRFPILLYYHFGTHNDWRIVHAYQCNSSITWKLGVTYYILLCRSRIYYRPHNKIR